VTIVRRRIACVILLREPDGAALLQLRDDTPGLPHANLWVPPGGGCEEGESHAECAVRELREETEYRGGRLRFLAESDLDDVPFAPPSRLVTFWDVYDGVQPIVCHEGQALEFVPRDRVPEIAIPAYLVDLWDLALAAWQSVRDEGRAPAGASCAGAPPGTAR
jgi:8-oxo-dGTP pyrophosphatase MutT (NUDIX family)